MATLGRARSCLGAMLLVSSLSGSGVASAWQADGDASSGIALVPPNTGVQAAFTERSYIPGTVATFRLLINGGVPPHYHGYDRGFLRWLALHHEQVDFFSDDDLDRVARGDDLARAYDLIVFSGHEEYVTEHEYDLIEHYRNLGGNLAFLSA